MHTIRIAFTLYITYVTQQFMFTFSWYINPWKYTFQFSKFRIFLIFFFNIKFDLFISKFVTINTSHSWIQCLDWINYFYKFDSYSSILLIQDIDLNFYSVFVTKIYAISINSFLLLEQHHQMPKILIVMDLQHLLSNPNNLLSIPKPLQNGDQVIDP